jgi:hypothetical protein
LGFFACGQNAHHPECSGEFGGGEEVCYEAHARVVAEDVVAVEAFFCNYNSISLRIPTASIDYHQRGVPYKPGPSPDVPWT